MKNQKGITLIALVITIIILLILAGVALNLAVGNQGILTKAEQARDLTQEAADKETVELARAAIYIDAYAERVPGTTIDWSKYYTEENFNKYLNGNGTVSDFSINDDGTIAFSYRRTQNSEPTKLLIDDSGKLTVDILANKITSLNYGDKVEYSANGITDWRIFYKEGRDVFLIASDYLPNSKIDLDKTKMSAKGNYVAFWAEGLSGLQKTNQLSLFKATAYTLNGRYGNSKFVSTLLNTNNWTSFVDDTKATYAIGSPTIEMWLASWNEKYNDTLTFAVEESGYTVGIDANNLTHYIDGSVMRQRAGYVEANANISSGYGNMYFPHSSDSCSPWNGTYGYWFASPIARCYSNTVPFVSCDGGIGNDKMGYIEYSIRPVVCLKDTITATKTGDVWRLEE